MSFLALGISTQLNKTLTELKFNKPYPIQEQAIPAVLNGKDILGIAKTGSGKTASYALPILMNLQQGTPTKNRHINVLVLVPTRELAGQVNDVFRMFSEGLPTRVKSMAVFGGVSINPQMIALQGVNVLIATPGRLIELVESKAVHLSDIDQINQIAYLIHDDEKGPFLRKLLTENDWKQILIFTSSTYKADNVANKLRKHGIKAAAIHSKKSQTARTEALAKFKEGKTRVLVATDLLARGIDIELLPCVINYELPRSPKDYVHRIGRTGRAESSGEAITLISTEDEHHFKVIQKKMGRKVELIETESLF